MNSYDAMIARRRPSTPETGLLELLRDGQADSASESASQEAVAPPPAAAPQEGLYVEDETLQLAHAREGADRKAALEQMTVRDRANRLALAQKRSMGSLQPTEFDSDTPDQLHKPKKPKKKKSALPLPPWLLVLLLAIGFMSLAVALVNVYYTNLPPPEISRPSSDEI